MSSLRITPGEIRISTRGSAEAGFLVRSSLQLLSCRGVSHSSRKRAKSSFASAATKPLWTCLDAVQQQFYADSCTRRSPVKFTAMPTKLPMFRASSSRRSDEMLTEPSTRLSFSAFEHVSQRFHEHQVVDPPK